MMIDNPMQRGQEWLSTLLQFVGVSADIKTEMVTSSNASEEPDSYWLTINEVNLQPEQVKVLVGADGSVLDAIQYLANSILNLNQTQEQQASYTIELNGYRVRRQAEVQAIAESAATLVRLNGQEVEIKDLSSAERRQVHTFLKDFTDLETFSQGKEPHRHLVVRPAS
jgi:spoIIIJ-associated protein